MRNPGMSDFISFIAIDLILHCIPHKPRKGLAAPCPVYDILNRFFNLWLKPDMLGNPLV